MGHSLDISIPHASRTRKLFRPRWRYSSLCTRILLILLLLFLIRWHHLFLLYRSELVAKYSATKLATPDSSLLKTEFASSELPRDLLAHRKEWKGLGAGCEGKTFVFNDSVIKTYTPNHSPFRNCMFQDPDSKWPSEIAASMEFGGIWEPADNFSDMHGFLPVKAHFMASTSQGSDPEWHLVTPFLPYGNLDKLAKTIKHHHPATTLGALDSTYRPLFNRLLDTLSSLHAGGFCHDDMTPSNIFVAESTHWVLGDLGNVRNLDHAYHSTNMWLRDNHQLADCRANDVFRALKSYLHFLRAASHAGSDFDTHFFGGSEAFSRLYWWVLDDAAEMSAGELKMRSEVEDPKLDFKQETWDLQPRVLPMFVGRRKALEIAVEERLKTRNPEAKARFWGMTGVVGVPGGEC